MPETCAIPTRAQCYHIPFRDSINQLLPDFNCVTVKEIHNGKYNAEYIR